MILGRRSRLFAFAFTAVTVTAAVSWGATVASIWLPVDAKALPVIRLTAAVSSVALMARWLKNGAIAYLLDVLLSQRDETRRQVQTTKPLPRLVR